MLFFGYEMEPNKIDTKMGGLLMVQQLSWHECYVNIRKEQHSWIISATNIILCCLFITWSNPSD